VFQAYDGDAALELCQELPDIGLLVLNADGTGLDTPKLVRDIRALKPGLPVLHIGVGAIPGMPTDVPNLLDTFDVKELLDAVGDLLPLTAAQ